MIFQIKAGDPNRNVILNYDILWQTHDYGAAVFARICKQGDKRILVIDGKPSYISLFLPKVKAGANLASQAEPLVPA